MWYQPQKYIKPVTDINIGLSELKGELEEKQAKITLAMFLHRNLGLTTELLTGIDLFPDQIITIKGMMKHNYSLCVWGRGVSKTTTYSTNSKIYTKDGIQSLVEAFPDVDFSKGERWEELLTPKLLWNGKRWVKLERFLVQPKKPCMRVTTNLGYSQEGSVNHLVRVWDKEKCISVWKKYTDITKEDYVCISRKNIDNNNPSEEANVDEAYLVGLVLGDGCISPNNTSGATITSLDSEILEFCLKMGATGLRNKSGSMAQDAAFSTTTTQSLLEKYKFKRALSYDKQIPEKIFKNKENLKACIQGLMDTDGCAASGRLTLEYCSTSIEMAKQFHLSLLSFGIISNIIKFATPSPFGKAWKVVITGKNCKLFSERIGFRLTRKQKILDKHLENHVFNDNIDVIPGLKEYCQREIKSKLRLPKVLSDEWRNKIRRKDNQFNLTYDTLDNYLNFFKKTDAPIELLQPLIDMKEENFFFDKVESIEDIGNQDCLDFNIPDGEEYWSNGFISHNTWTAAVYCILQSIFYPGTTILIAGPTFRTARFIFNHIEKIVDSNEAQLLMQAMGAKSRRNDEFRWSINGGEIVAIPLNGEKIRGFRANVLVIDEFLLMSEEIVEKVLIPYLVVPKDVKRRKQLRAREDDLIARGIIKEEDRTKFKNEAKLIALSSASYTCEYLYRKYDEYVKAIQDPDVKEHEATYFVSQMAWDAIPEDRIDKSVIELAQSNESNMATFKREYGAQFLDGSDSYFSMDKMIRCTVPDGENPTLKLQGDKSRKYILAIDPNFSNSPTADDFAMCVIELDDIKDKKGTIVHSYAESGRDLKEHIRYFYYLWKSFDIEMITIDYAGYQFIDAVNEHELFRGDKIEFKMFDFVSEKDGDEYTEELKKARNGYNRQIHRIVYTQYFTSDFIRKANEWLQGCIDYKRIWFGGGIKANAESFEKASQAPIDVESLVQKDKIDKDESLIGYFIDNQEVLIKQTKYQAASIEVKTTARGVQSFDLPQMMKRDNSTDRMRRDSYTAMMLGTWCMKCYYDIVNLQVQDIEPTFEPMMI